MRVKSSSHPEDIVDEQPPQQDAAGADVVQVEQLDSIQGKRQAKQVIGYPVLWCHKTDRLTAIWAVTYVIGYLALWHHRQ